MDFQDPWWSISISSFVIGFWDKQINSGENNTSVTAVFRRTLQTDDSEDAEVTCCVRLLLLLLLLLLFWVDLIKCVNQIVRPSVSPSMPTYVRTSVRPKEVSSISMKFGVYVEVDTWCMTVCRMTRSKVKVKVTSPTKLEILPFSKGISSAIYSGGWQLTTDSSTREQYLNLLWTDFPFILSYFLCHVTLNLAETSVVKSRPSVPHVANFYYYYYLIALPCCSNALICRRCWSNRIAVLSNTGHWCSRMV